MKKIIIAGAGISGISIARLLDKHCDVTVLEKKNKPGGLINCERIEGALFHKVGGHVFNSKNSVVLNWFWNHFDKENEFIKAKRNAKIWMDNELIGYPIENYLYKLHPGKVKSILNELLLSEKKEVDNFHDFLISNFGETLYELYFGPYNKKIWNTDLKDVPLEWLKDKLPMPSLKDILFSNIVRNEETEMVHATFYYAKNNGSQFIIDRLSEGLKISTSTEVKKLEKENHTLIINESINCDHFIYCGDIRELKNIYRSDDAEINQLMEEVSHFKSNGTSNVLCETDPTDLSWLYIPGKEFKAHRIIYTGNFSESNNVSGKRKTCVVEYSGKQSQEDMKNELIKLPGNLTPLAFNYEPNSYIIHTRQTRSLVAALKNALKKNNIYLLGRFAEWEYHNMDKCIESSMALSSYLLNDKSGN